MKQDLQRAVEILHNLVERDLIKDVESDAFMEVAEFLSENASLWPGGPSNDPLDTLDALRRRLDQPVIRKGSKADTEERWRGGHERYHPVDCMCPLCKITCRTCDGVGWIDEYDDNPCDQCGGRGYNRT